ncbi:MAG: hypothetical protein U0M60_14455 [Clostridia bacterium]|nr:hypothetical protein [Clostridia bacterium]
MKKTPSYGIIKKTIGGIFMPREYRHIKQYEKEIFSLKEQGLTHREIGEKLGFSREKIEDFFRRYHRNQKKISSGISVKPIGRPRKDGVILPPSAQQLSKLSQLKYELAQKERCIKYLKMENELMRDFLSLTERK